MCEAPNGKMDKLLPKVLRKPPGSLGVRSKMVSFENGFQCTSRWKNIFITVMTILK